MPLCCIKLIKGILILYYYIVIEAAYIYIVKCNTKTCFVSTMIESTKESLDKAKEEVTQALEKIKRMAHLDDEKAKRIKSLIEETKKRL
ncbi:hypothetical protein CXF93_04065 [Moritella sp. Urea-trap-13]|nr:hypothetical protein CXF93_04065 [Moritella sp. Urea-trap-13]